MKIADKPLFVLEMANNHMGDVNHGITIIKAFGEVCRNFPMFKFAFKLQYRDLDTFIHPSFKGRDDVKYVKRFSETKLSRNDFNRLVEEMRNNGFITMSTPFDEPSVDVILEQNLEIIKVASCSFTDWSLLERIVKTDKPVIASTAGASIEEIDRVVSFLSHRNKEFAIMHCVGEYPTPIEKMNLSQLDFLKQRYPGLTVGFSTHEEPDNLDLVKIAVAKNASIFEKHVGVPTPNAPLNAYSSTPEQYEKWLNSAKEAFIMCGQTDRLLTVNKNERDSLLSLQRGAFVKRDIKAGETVSTNDVYFAFPASEGQIRANDWSKYTTFTAKAEIAANAAVNTTNTTSYNSSDKVLEIAGEVKRLLKESGITIPQKADLEISHHYGIEKFYETGLTMITVVNREYCKKLLISLPGQFHPEQYHNQKEETFHVLYGNVKVKLNGEESEMKPGDVITIQPGVRHSFITETGSVIEEISSTHFVNDSFYTDESISKNKNRKTLLTYWIS